MNRVTAGAIRALREFTARTAKWPFFGRCYKAIYDLQVRRAERALAGVSGIGSVLLRSSSPITLQPGVSDIDLVVLFEAHRTPADEYTTVERVHAAVKRENRGAPLVRYIHIFAAEELEALAALADFVFSNIRADTRTLSGTPHLPPCSTDA